MSPGVEGKGKEEAEPSQTRLRVKDVLFQVNGEGAGSLILPGSPPMDKFGLWKGEEDVVKLCL